ncbi:hypothetical protein BCR39DRAFT_564873 [Naematelia encephala]|uniref:STB6-like N-terminal domain-containing protein n=1 Tax=Naematelia encephala TaxID=71784 RepID=A0A1Y2B663_9TREE|nr:hypothetical protein BCR39DRAFT_564873 [Naematelia encephala]
MAKQQISNGNGNGILLNSPTSPSTSQLSGTLPSPPLSPRVSEGQTKVQGLLIPTDRNRDELESKWLPRLGRLRVLKEVVLTGYSLFSLRTWYLSRTHWSLSIVTQTGKPTEQVSVYLIVPSLELSEHAGMLELASAIQSLSNETHATPRKTDYGTLLVATPSAFGQDAFPIPGGDFRQARPYLVVNTDLRRLGCGGRAAMGMERPISTVRRKFIELYRLPAPPSAQTTVSPTTSPTRSTDGFNSPHPILSDPFTGMLTEMVRLVQAALAIWGLYGPDREEQEIDGLFCDETKAAIFGWRRLMGMEHEESMRLEKETSGGCIDPKTLAALLGSITSVRYQLAALGVEKLPKDPFTSVKRFLHAWQSHQVMVGRGADKVRFLTVASIRALHTHYLNERTRSPADALKVHRLLAHATSSLSANLKGGAAEDTPLRKREHHLRFSRDSLPEDSDNESGVGLIVPEGQVGPVAPPDVITTDLEAYTKGILKSREKDWDVMGARRVAELWNGHTAENFGSAKRSHSRGMLRRRTASHDPVGNDDASDGSGPKGAFEKIARTGHALRGGFGLVSRRNTAYETSDSDTGAGPGPNSLKQSLIRRKQNTVPTVIEPWLSTSPSLNMSMRNLDRSGTRPAFLSATSRPASKRPSINTNMSGDASDAISRVSHRTASPSEDRASFVARSMSDRALAWRDRGRTTAMLRTSSDGADVMIEEGGMEWEVVNPHGTGRGQSERYEHVELKRRHSLQDRTEYKNMRILSITDTNREHLAVDVQMCRIVLEMRERERQLATKEQELQILEKAVYTASDDLIAVHRARQQIISRLTEKAQVVQRDLQKTLDDVDDDHALQWASKKIQYYLSEDTNMNEVMWSLRDLRKRWEEARAGVRQRAEGTENGNAVQGGGGRRWYWFW